MDHTIEFEIEDKDYVEGEKFNYKIKIKPTEGDDFVIQRGINCDDLAYMRQQKSFIEDYIVNLTCIVFKDGMGYSVKMGLIEINDVLSIADVGYIEEKLISNIKIREKIKDSIKHKRLMKEEQDRLLRKSFINPGEYSTGTLYDGDAIYTDGTSFVNLNPTYSTGSTTTYAKGIAATQTIHIDPLQYNSLLGSLSNHNQSVSISSSITSGNVGTINGTSIIVDEFKPITFLPSEDAYDLMIRKSLSLFNKSERAKIFQGALNSNRLSRAIIQMAEKLNLPNWCEETA